ncbi:unnamed protein product, partial [Rangifer tarandus platyrhynchus]
GLAAPPGFQGRAAEGRCHSPPASAGGEIRFHRTDRRSGNSGDTASLGHATAGMAHAASSLHVSHVSTAPAPAPRLGSGPGSVKAEARRRGLKREASGERRWGPNGPARASRRSRGVQRAGFWEV